MTDTKTLVDRLRKIANFQYSSASSLGQIDPQKVSSEAADRLEELERENVELKRLYEGKLPCGHLRQYGTSGNLAPIKCFACENAALKTIIKELEEKYSMKVNLSYGPGNDSTLTDPQIPSVT